MTEPTDDIRNLELQCLELAETIDALAKATREYEQTHTMIIDEKWEESKDKSLSNATKRAAAVEAILQGIPEYTEMKADLESLRKQKARMEIDLRFMLREDRKERLNTDQSFVDVLRTLLEKA